MRQIKEISEISTQYDGFLIDLWGVTHDGQQPFPGVIHALTHLQAQGKSVVFLSNSPRRAYVVKERLKEIGIPADLYQGIYTSGEETYRFLREIVPARGYQRVFHIGSERDFSLFDEINLERVQPQESPDFILCTDTLSWGQKVNDYDDTFSTLIAQRCPLVCANSDRFVVARGQLSLCAGALAERYQELGGDVTFFGKPHRAVYTSVLKMLPTLDKRRILAIGDSLHTDIQGANRASIDSLFIGGGVHMTDLGIVWGQEPELHKLETLCKKYSVAPTYFMGTFV